jgi:hypothetical protein
MWMRCERNQGQTAAANKDVACPMRPFYLSSWAHYLISEAKSEKTLVLMNNYFLDSVKLYLLNFTFSLTVANKKEHLISQDKCGDGPTV